MIGPFALLGGRGVRQHRGNVEARENTQGAIEVWLGGTAEGSRAQGQCCARNRSQFGEAPGRLLMTVGSGACVPAPLAMRTPRWLAELPLTAKG